ncbi:GHMP family kinase ATP-binding protein [Streptomyces sp. NPDC002537]
MDLQKEYGPATGTRSLPYAPVPPPAMDPATDPARPAVVTARSPLRISLAGGGTDIPSYSTRFGGLVIGCAIDRYVGVTVFPREFSGRLRAATDSYELYDSAADHPNSMTRACLLRAGLHRDRQVAVFGDVPPGSGLGGSAAFAVSLLHAAAHPRPAPARELAETASRVEIEDLGRAVGKQDHYLAAYGGIRLLRFHPSGHVDPEPLELVPRVRAELEERLLLFHTGISRDAGDVLAEQNRRTLEGHSDSLTRLHAIRRIADEMADRLRTGDVDGVAGLVEEHWNLKSKLGSRVSSPQLQALHDRAVEAGAAGGKLLGSGGGGFLLLVCDPRHRAEVRRAMDDAGLRALPFRFTDSGSEAVHVPL